MHHRDRRVQRVHRSADTGTKTGFDHVLFDTAPTGHTIRLLQLPGSWTDFLNAGGEATCLGLLSGLDRQRAIYAQAVAALQDPTRTRMVLVARAHASALGEIERTNRELTGLGIAGAHLVINAVLPADAGEEDLARAIRAREAAALAAMPPTLAALPRDTLQLKATNMVGIAVRLPRFVRLGGGVRDALRGARSGRGLAA